MDDKKRKVAYFYDGEFWQTFRLYLATAYHVFLLQNSTLLDVTLIYIMSVTAAEYAGMYYGADHPMKPPRIAMTHDLILGYGLHEHLDVYVSYFLLLLEVTSHHFSPIPPKV